MRKRLTAWAVVAGAALAGATLAGPTEAAFELDTDNLVVCAREGGICKMPHPTNVYYGVPGKTYGRPFPQGGSVQCNTPTFGDPAPGQAKTCWYAPKLNNARRGGYRDDRDYDGRRDYGDRYGRDDRYDRPRRSYDDRPRYDDDYDRPRRSYSPY